MKTSTLLIGATGLTILGFGIKKALSLKGKADAAANLKIGFTALNFTKVNARDGIFFDVILKATNNSPHDLNFTQPFVEVSILGAKNQMETIAVSNDAGAVVSLKARTSSELRFNLSIGTIQALKLPSLLLYLINRMVNKTAANKKVLVEYGLTSEGFDIKNKQDVLI